MPLQEEKTEYERKAFGHSSQDFDITTLRLCLITSISGSIAKLKKLNIENTLVDDYENLKLYKHKKEFKITRLEIPEFSLSKQYELSKNFVEKDSDIDENLFTR